MANLDETRSERAFGDQAELYRLIAQVVGDTFFEYDFEYGRLIWSSDPATGLLGYPSGKVDLQRDKLLELAHPEDREKLSNLMRRMFALERADLDFRMMRKDGESCWVKIAGIPLPEREGEPRRLVGVLRATQDLHEAQESLYEARRMETVGNMASGIAHEFNNHLTPISGYLEIAIDQLGPDHSLTEGLTMALNRVNYCAELVGQIQAYGRKSMLMPKRVELSRILPTVARLAVSSHAKGVDSIELVEKVEDNLPPVWVDQGQFQQAMVHLIRNAIEAMPDGGKVTVRAEANPARPSVPARSGKDQGPDNYVRICVSDTGIGISPENRTRIFDPFFTTHSRTKARGMGLPMVQGMVAQHGGWMEIKTEIGEGTEVALYLPVKEEDLDRSSDVVMDADGTMAVAPAAAPGRMLIADDEPYIRRLIKLVFQAEDWHIDEAVDYNEVLQRVMDEGVQYDVMILDITMPGPPPEEVLKQIAERCLDSKVLMISGYSKDERIERMVKSVSGEFMSKPFSPKALLSKVDELVS